MTPEERLQAILAYCDAPTKGPWVAPDNNMTHQVYANGTPIASFRIRKCDRRGLAEYRANAVFTASARTDLPRVARALLYLLNEGLYELDECRRPMSHFPESCTCRYGNRITVRGKATAILEGKDAE